MASDSKKSRSAEPCEQSELTFEQALERLEQIVRQLEDGELGLDEALGQYEQGVRYLKFCHGALEKAERRIELVARIDAEGKPHLEPFDDVSLPLDEKREARSRRRSLRRTSQEGDAGDGQIDVPGGLF